MAKMIHKPNNKYFKLFRKTDVTMRFPEVNNVLDIWPKTKYFLILTEETKKFDYFDLFCRLVNFQHQLRVSW